MKKIFALLLVFGFLLAACGSPATATPVAAVIPASVDSVIAEGHIIPAQDATLMFQARGTVVEVNFKIGDKVKEGDLLARLGGQSDAAFAAAQLDLVGAEQALKTLNESSDAARAQATIALDKAGEAYDKAVDYYDSLFDPYEYDKLIFHTIRTPVGIRRIPDIKTIKVDKADEETISDADADMALKKALLDEAQRAYDRLKDGPDQDQLALLEARLNAARAVVASFAILAPFDGTVMDVNIVTGEQVGPETWAVKIADTSTWYVETSDLTELEVVKIALGLGASIVPDALPDVKMTGKVESISQAFTSQGGDILYRVKIEMDEMDPRVLWGMTVEVTFEPLP
jgi:multidrug resistance efflux pump